MISWLAAAFLVVGFIAIAAWLGLVTMSGRVVALSRHSLAILRDAQLSDDAKEAATRQNALEFFRLAFALALGGAAAVSAPLGVLWLLDRLGVVSLAAACDVAVSPAFLAASGLLAVLALAISWRSKKTRKTPNYSALERVLHRVAFKTRAAQLALADIEDRMFAKQLASCPIVRPVFITALPRAGTTLLLECCAGMSQFASHCYRDMPFVLVPCLWNRFSVGFRRCGERHERAHGDGMLIDFDSPEALEEVLWKAFWQRHYRSDRIVPWSEADGEDADEFREFFQSHMRKIILVRRGGDAAATTRYLSKNNLNIARVALLRRLFPDAIIVVPFREPLQHAASLLKQHRNFLRIHREDPFASEYMRAIGHYDFGENLRPVDFDGWFDRRESRDAESLGFWVEYWSAGYRHLLEHHADAVRFLDYDALCQAPECGLRRAAEILDCRDAEAFCKAAGTIHAATPRSVDAGVIPASILSEASRLLDALKQKAA